MAEKATIATVRQRRGKIVLTLAAGNPLAEITLPPLAALSLGMGILTALDRRLKLDSRKGSKAGRAAAPRTDRTIVRTGIAPGARPGSEN